MSLLPRKTSEGTEPTDREREELLGYARNVLGRDLERFMATGDVPSHLESGGGTFGRLHDARSAGFTRRLIGIYRPTTEEADPARAWHEFCEDHGYPTGDRCGADDDPANGYPPRPLGHGDGVWALLTWRSVRSALQGGQEPQQLDLLATARQEQGVTV